MERHDDARRIQCLSIPQVFLCMAQPDLRVAAAVCLPRIYSTLNMHCSSLRVMAVRKWHVKSRMSLPCDHWRIQGDV